MFPSRRSWWRRLITGRWWVRVRSAISVSESRTRSLFNPKARAPHRTSTIDAQTYDHYLVCGRPLWRSVPEHLILRAEAVWNFQPPPPAFAASLVEAVGAVLSLRCRPSWLICATWRDQKTPGSWSRISGVGFGPEVAPAARSDGGVHQVLGAPPLEPGKSEHLREKAELPSSGGIRSSQGDGEGAERDQMTSGRLP